MARKPSEQPTDGELEILQILWEWGPCGLNTVWKTLCQKREVANTTVATMLKVMMQKGLVTRKKGPSGYLWSAKRSRESTEQTMVHKLIDRAFDGSASRLVAHVLDGDRLSAAELAQIRDLVERHRRSKGNKGKRS